MLRRLICVSLLVSSASCVAEEATVLPDAKEVKQVSIKFDHPELDLAFFTTTGDDWTNIRKQLLPARVDKTPASWEWMGTVEIVKTNDDPFRVELYWSPKEQGAFAAGMTFKERVYHRGGDSQMLLEELVKAFDNADDKKFEPISLNRAIGRAKQLEIKVMKESGGFYDAIELSDKQEIEKLGELLDAKEAIGFSPKDDISAAVAADIAVIRKGTKIASFQLRGNQIYFGSDQRYVAELKTDKFYRQLRELVLDPLDD